MSEVPRKCPVCEGMDFIRPERVRRSLHLLGPQEYEELIVEPEDRATWKDPIRATVEVETLICAFCGMIQTYASNIDTLNRVRKTR